MVPNYASDRNIKTFRDRKIEYVVVYIPVRTNRTASPNTAVNALTYIKSAFIDFAIFRDFNPIV